MIRYPCYKYRVWSDTPDGSSKEAASAKKVETMQHRFSRPFQPTGAAGQLGDGGYPLRSVADRPAAFSMVELIVAMAVITILIALLLPAVAQVREAARRTQCLNHLRNIALAQIQFDQVHGRLPASGNFYDPGPGKGEVKFHHAWTISILPYVEQNNLYQSWDEDLPIDDPKNEPLTESEIPVYTCPSDISLIGSGDLSYVVNGGWGYTIRTGDGVGDCPVDWRNNMLDLNGDGKTCTGDDSVDDEDRKRYKYLGLFFVENWKSGGTVRHHSLNDVFDGTSQTFMVSENVRAGYDPDDERATFANPHPYRNVFYIGIPCIAGSCAKGTVDYSLCNSGADRINAGLESPEGQAPHPNSFHPEGVNMAYADGHASFISEEIDGAVYAALTSPQGRFLNGSPLEQVIVSGEY